MRARLLPDRTAKVEALLYLLGTGGATAGTVATVLLAPSTLTGPDTAARLVDLVTGIVLVVAALARRPRPDLLPPLAIGGLALLAASTVATVVVDPRATSGTYLAATVLLAAAVRRCPPRVAVSAGLLALVAFVVSSVSRSILIGSTPEGIAQNGVPEPTASAAFGWVTALLVGLLLRTRDERRRVEALARVRSSERLLVARELHDLVARHVTGMVVRTQALTVVAPDLPAPARDALADVERAGNDALEAMRRMVGVLREEPEGLLGLDDLPSAAIDVESAVRGAIDEAGPTGPGVRVDVDPELPPLPRELLTTVHRVVAEGLTNVSRHAPGATHVVVAVTLDSDDLVLSVGNDGVGNARGLRRGGFGLVGMGERVRALGGTLDSSAEGTDRWVLTARIPVREAVAPGT